MRPPLRSRQGSTQDRSFPHSYNQAYSRGHLTLKAPRTILESQVTRLPSVLRPLLDTDRIRLLDQTDAAISAVRDFCQRTDICRICETVAPIEFFEEHIESCECRYKSETTVNKVNLKDIIGQFPLNYLDIFIFLLFKRTISLDPKLKETCDELSLISIVLSSLDVMLSNGIGFEALNLVFEKLKSSHALNEAINVFRRTSMESERSGLIGRQYLISEFEFLKKISKGASATVFLVKKKLTGDIFAIKAISKKILNRKNQRRVFCERDILMTFNNPFVVQFCMFF
jgi:hypothetical protein